MIQFCEEYGSDHLPPCPNVENVRSEVVRSRIMDTVQKFHGYVFFVTMFSLCLSILPICFIKVFFLTVLIDI